MSITAQQIRARMTQVPSLRIVGAEHSVPIYCPSCKRIVLEGNPRLTPQPADRVCGACDRFQTEDDCA